MSLEGNETREYGKMEDLKLPEFHMEKLGNTRLEQLENKPVAEILPEVCEKVYSEEVAPKAGVDGAFREVAKEGTMEEFNQVYEQYVISPRQLKAESPEMYEFLKDRIFMGREFHLQGMEDFMNKNTPRSWDAEQVYSYREIPVHEFNDPEGKLTKYQIVDSDIGEGIYFSCGSADEMAEAMDIQQGDTRLGAKGTCGLVSARNLMTLCGQDVTEREVAVFAKIYDFADFDSSLPTEERGTVYVEKLPELIGRHGIETELTEYQKKPMSMDEIADKLDHGYRGLFVHNAGLIGGVENANLTPAGVLAQSMEAVFPEAAASIREHHETHRADHVATFESAVRDGSNNVVGFYICSSSYDDAGKARLFVPAQTMQEALDVKGGALLFTTNPYLNKPFMRNQ